MKKKKPINIQQIDAEDNVNSQSNDSNYPGYLTPKIHNNEMGDEYVIDEEKYSKSSTLRHDNELFDEERNICMDLISIKRISFKDTEDWEIFYNKKSVLLLKGIRFTAKERSFFRTIPGLLYIMSGYKSGLKSVSDFKRNIRDNL